MARPNIDVDTTAAAPSNRFIKTVGSILSQPKRPSRGKFITGMMDSETSAPKSSDDFNADIKAYLADPTPDSGAKLLSRIDPVISRAVASNVGSPSPLIAGRARLLAMQAIPKYDGQASLYTFLSNQLMPLRREAAASRVGVKIPRNIVSQQNALRRAELDLEDELGRSPSTAELADHTGIPPKAIAKLSKLHIPGIAEKEMSFGDGEVSTSSDQGVMADDQLWLHAVYYDLNPTNQFIMEHTLGMFGKPRLSNTEIARRLKVSPGAISQRKTTIQQKLNKG